jgi:hypothetical protein
MEDWILVLDENEDVCRRQLEVCRVSKPPLQGVVMCDKATNVDVCHKVDYFPAFCHVPTDRCVYGLRRTSDEFAELATLVPVAHTKVQPGLPKEKGGLST